MGTVGTNCGIVNDGMRGGSVGSEMRCIVGHAMLCWSHLLLLSKVVVTGMRRWVVNPSETMSYCLIKAMIGKGNVWSCASLC